MYYNIPVRGTCAHAYIMSYQNQNLTEDYFLNDDPEKNLYKKSLEFRKEFNWELTNLDELKAFCSFTKVYKETSLLLVDTYNTLHSGVKNAILVSLALNYFQPGTNIRGIRLDSGDLALLSKESKILFKEASEKSNNEGLRDLKVSASNDINEKSLLKFNEDGHELDILGIGTNLVTCQLQPYCLINTEIVNENYEYDIKNVLNLKENGKLIRRYVIHELNNGNHIDELNLELDLKINENEIIEKMMKILYKNGECFNEINLHISRDFTKQNFNKIKHMINLYSKDMDENNMKYIIQ
jgi:putative nicotinate phosphoribosyltransferase